jgi:murein L,D-transpeptidase YafK
MDEKHEILQSWNDLHLSVQAGHHKFGKPFEDLGRNSYGPCFLMLNYPNSEDKKRGRTGSGIGIHGTNDPISLGNPATSGCIRMRNVEIVWLSQWLKRGTPVKILASSTEN